MSTDRPDPFLIADDPALDFLNSVCAPWGEEIEWVTSTDDLWLWMGLAGFDRPPEPPTDDALAKQARELREWFRGLMTLHADCGFAEVTTDELAPLNALLARDRLQDALVPGPGGRPVVVSQRDWSDPQAILFPLAQAMSALIAEADFNRVRLCEGETCTLWFRDTSKSNRRRWCSMAVCGNRAKVKGFRARQRDGT